jgi:hypothetical protein
MAQVIAVAMAVAIAFAMGVAMAKEIGFAWRFDGECLTHARPRALSLLSVSLVPDTRLVVPNVTTGRDQLWEKM